MAAMATMNSVRLVRQRCLSVETLNRPATATNTTAASTGWGNAASRCEKNSTTTRMIPAAKAPDSGVRAPPPSLTSDCDMPPLTGKAAAQPGGEIGSGEREEFLVRIQPAAVFGREHAANGGRLHRAEQETGKRQRQQVVQVGPVNRREAECRQPLRHCRPAASPRALPGRASPKPRMPPTTTNNATGLFLRKIFPSTSTARAMPPTVSEVGLVSPRCFRK